MKTTPHLSLWQARLTVGLKRGSLACCHRSHHRLPFLQKLKTKPRGFLLTVWQTRLCPSPAALPEGDPEGVCFPPAAVSSLNT